MTRRRPGRPPLDASDPSVKLSLSLPSARYSALLRTAAAERQTVADVLRRAVDRAIKESKLSEPDPTD